MDAARVAQQCSCHMNLILPNSKHPVIIKSADTALLPIHTKNEHTVVYPSLLRKLRRLTYISLGFIVTIALTTAYPPMNLNQILT